MDWIDRWARQAAAPVDRADPAPSSPHVGVSRRTFLRRAAAIGTVAWSVPVLQSVAAPAASASVGTALGDPCNDLGVCAGGDAYCNGTVCGGVGALCPTSICASGLPCSGHAGGAETCGGPGATCSSSAACTYGNCNGIRCGGLLATCATSAECRGNWNCNGGRCLPF
jgi:hypothetical protein